MKSCLAALFLAAIAPAAFAATPLEAALAAAEDGPDYSYDLSIENAKTDAVLRVDPSLPLEQKLSVISPPEAEWSDDFRKRLKSMREDDDGSMWCSQFVENIPADAELVDETDATARYRFKPVPGEADGGDGIARMIEYIEGRVTVDKAQPGIRAFELFAPRPFKPATVARIESFRMNVQCTPAPDGRMRIEALNMDVSGSALFQKFDESETQRISNLTPVETGDQ